jgi:hypothetical protein
MTGGEYRYALQLGAERERRRIRRVLLKALSARRGHPDWEVQERAWINAVIRAPKKARQK